MSHRSPCYRLVMCIMIRSDPSEHRAQILKYANKYNMKVPSSYQGTVFVADHASIKACNMMHTETPEVPYKTCRKVSF